MTQIENISEIANRTAALAALRTLDGGHHIPAVVTAISTLEAEVDAWVAAVPAADRAETAQAFRENDLTLFDPNAQPEAYRQLLFVVEMLEGHNRLNSTNYYWKGIR